MRNRTRNIIAATIIGGAILCLGANYSTSPSTDERLVKTLEKIERHLGRIANNTDLSNVLRSIDMHLGRMARELSSIESHASTMALHNMIR